MCMTLNVADKYTYWRIVARKCYKNTKCLNGGTCEEDYEHSTYSCECPWDVGGYHCEHKYGEYLNSHSNYCSTQMLQKLPTRSFPSAKTSNFMNSFITKSQVTSSHRCGNDFSVGWAKIGEKQYSQIQSITLCNTYFPKKRYIWYTMGVEQSPPKLWVFENFCVKSMLTVCKVTCNCKLQKILGDHDAQCTTCCPQLLVAAIRSPGSQFPRLWKRCPFIIVSLPSVIYRLCWLDSCIYFQIYYVHIFALYAQFYCISATFMLFVIWHFI